VRHMTPFRVRCDACGYSYGRMSIAGQQLRWQFVESATSRIVDEFVLHK
jgi:hypothetical protein